MVHCLKTLLTLLKEIGDAHELAGRRWTSLGRGLLALLALPTCLFTTGLQRLRAGCLEEKLHAMGPSSKALHLWPIEIGATILGGRKTRDGLDASGSRLAIFVFALDVGDTHTHPLQESL